VSNGIINGNIGGLHELVNALGYFPFSGVLLWLLSKLSKTMAFHYRILWCIEVYENFWLMIITHLCTSSISHYDYCFLPHMLASRR